jgi:hypothetical protein
LGRKNAGVGSAVAGLAIAGGGGGGGIGGERGTRGWVGSEWD